IPADQQAARQVGPASPGGHPPPHQPRHRRCRGPAGVGWQVVSARSLARTPRGNRIMDRMNIATAPHRNSLHWQQSTITWDELVLWMLGPADTKEAGNYILGTLAETTV